MNRIRPQWFESGPSDRAVLPAVFFRQEPNEEDDERDDNDNSDGDEDDDDNEDGQEDEGYSE